MITLGLVDSVDDNGVYVTMPGSKGVLRGPYKFLSTVAAGTTVLVASTDDGEQVVVGPVGGGVGWVNVRTFGATGDGVTDDTAAVHAARDAAGAGGVVYLPGGTYKMNASLSVADQTWMFAPDAVGRCADTDTAVLTIAADGVEVNGGTLTGDWDWGTYVGEDTAPAISGNRGILLASWSGTRTGVTVRGVTFTRFGEEALRGYADDAALNDVLVESCVVSECRAGMSWWALITDGSITGLTVRGCRFESTWTPQTRGDDAYGGNFLTTYSGDGTISDVAIVDNYFGDGCGRLPLELWSPLESGTNFVKRATITGNRFGQGWYRTVSIGADEMVFRGNEVIDFYSYGEFFGTFLTIESNTWVGAHLWPIRITDSVIHANTFHVLETESALVLWHSSDVTISNNTILLDADVRGRTVAGGDGHGAGDAISVLKCARVHIDSNHVRFGGEVGEQHLLAVQRCQQPTVTGNVWQVGAGATDAGTTPTSTRVVVDGCSDALIVGNLVRSDIALSSTVSLVRDIGGSVTVKRRSWNGSAWVDETLQGVLNTPPGSPASGDEYLVGTSPTGAWAGNAGKFAEWDGGSWTYRTVAGWLLDSPDSDCDGFWVDVTPASGSVGDHLAVLSRGSLRNVFRDNDWSGQGGLFSLTATYPYRPADVVVVDNRYDRAPDYDSTVLVSDDLGYGQVTGSRGGNAALASLLTELAGLGLITDSSS